MKFKYVFFDRDGVLIYTDGEKTAQRDAMIADWGGTPFPVDYDTMMALFADVLDHLEARFGYRVDGVSMSVYSTILTVVNGLAIAFFNLFYDGGVFAARSVARFFFLGFEIPAQIILAVILLFLTVEKGIKEDQRIIAERKAVQQ